MRIYTDPTDRISYRKINLFYITWWQNTVVELIKKSLLDSIKNNFIVVMLSRRYLPIALSLITIKYVFDSFLYMSIHTCSQTLLQKSQFVNLTFSQMTLREISRLLSDTQSRKDDLNIIYMYLNNCLYKITYVLGVIQVMVVLLVAFCPLPRY